jgi:hypothetical protein
VNPIAALADLSVDISHDDETEKYSVASCDAKTSLAKSPNAQCVDLYAIWQRVLWIADFGFRIAPARLA